MKIVDDIIWFWDSFLEFPISVLGRITISLLVSHYFLTLFNSNKLNNVSLFQIKIFIWILILWGISPLINKTIYLYNNIKYGEGKL